MFSFAERNGLRNQGPLIVGMINHGQPATHKKVEDLLKKSFCEMAHLMETSSVSDRVIPGVESLGLLTVPFILSRFQFTPRSTVLSEIVLMGIVAFPNLCSLMRR